MATEKVPVFEPYPFEEGQRITIQSGPRAGDWEVVKVTDSKVTLRCPLSGRELEWARFCYFVEEQEREWPAEE